MSGVTELGYVRFGVSDLSAWRELASDILATEIVDEGEPGCLYLRTDSWHHRIILEESGEDDLTSAGFRVAGVEEFSDIKQKLSAAGISYTEGGNQLATQRRVLDIISLEDPAGNPIEIFHGPQVDAYKPFHPSRGMFGKFVTGDGGVGHMILRHNGFEDTYNFYTLLGMRGGIEYKFPLEDGATRDVMFMHCNSRDHTVAFGPPSKKSINHLMLEVDNIDDVFLTHEKVQASQYPVMISLGKHANDHMFSFYFATPSGWFIEVGCSGRPATHQSEYYTRDTYGHVFGEQAK